VPPPPPAAGGPGRVSIPISEDRPELPHSPSLKDQISSSLQHRLPRGQSGPRPTVPPSPAGGHKPVLPPSPAGAHALLMSGSVDLPLPPFTTAEPRLTRTIPSFFDMIFSLLPDYGWQVQTTPRPHFESNDCDCHVYQYTCPRGYTYGGSCTDGVKCCEEW
jgi:hypothetical protein